MKVMKLKLRVKKRKLIARPVSSKEAVRRLNKIIKK